MIVTITDKMRGTLTKDGSVLKRMRSRGGLPKSLLTAGITLLAATVITGGLFLAAGMAWGTLAMGGVLGIPGFVLLLNGITAQKKRRRGYLDYYQKVTKLETEELELADREILEPETVLIGHPLKNKRRKEYSLGCFITKHFLIAPLSEGACYLRRIQDMTAAVYSNQSPGIEGCKSGIVFLSKADDLPFYQAAMTKDECMEAIAILKEKNPGLITDQEAIAATIRETLV